MKNASISLFSIFFLALYCCSTLLTSASPASSLKHTLSPAKPTHNLTTSSKKVRWKALHFQSRPTQSRQERIETGNAQMITGLSNSLSLRKADQQLRRRALIQRQSESTSPSLPLHS